MHFDHEKLRQIISNLLSNAIEFTPEKGNIYISVTENTAFAPNRVPAIVIKVKDTGFGIPENQIPFIFDRFYQLNNSHTRKTEGSGIGLALTKELVKLMDGDITVKSPPTGALKGTEFTVVLPIVKIEEIIDNPGEEMQPATYTAEAATNTAGTVPVTETEQRQSSPLILLVEDNADVVAYTASCLPDYRLAVGKDGREGFDIACDSIPDLIVTDVMPPQMNGFELLQKIRQSERTSHIPVIMLTAKAVIHSKLEGLRFRQTLTWKNHFIKKNYWYALKNYWNCVKTCNPITSAKRVFPEKNFRTRLFLQIIPTVRRRKMFL